MTDLRTAAQMALDAIQDARDYLDMVNTQAAEAKSRRLTKTLKALRAALAQGEQEPVAVVDANDEGYWADILPDRGVRVGQLLYAAPPQREWQGLTDEEVVERANADYSPEDFARGVAWAELKLKEKNI